MVTFSEAQLIAWLSPLVWPFLRTLALFSAAPVLSMRSIPVRTRIGLAFFIAVCAQPSIQGQAVALLSDASSVGTALQEVAVGLVMGFAVRVAFAGIELAGELIGLQMGLNFAGFFNPGTGDQSNGISRFLGTIATLMFVATNAHLFLLAAVIHSFEVFPAAGGVSKLLQMFPPGRLGAELFYMALWIALPVIAILMFVNMVLGVVSRVAPQINIFAVGFPVTLISGLVALFMTLPLMELPMQGILERAIPLLVGR